MHFTHPEQLWWLVVVGVFALFAAQRERMRATLLGAFANGPMLARLAAEYSPRRARIKSMLVVAALASLVIALSGPQWGSRMVHVEREGIDVMLAVDCSSSMNAQDVKPSRLLVARRELGDLVKQLEGNRLGLVGFAGSAFTFCPLTLDVSATGMFLDQLDTNSMPIPGTSLGEAIKTAAQAFPKDDPNQKVIVLLTDGEDHHSKPVEAAKEAAKQGIKIFTVGIGNPTGEPIPEKDETGKSDYVRDASGNVVMSRLDEATLQQIASVSGGTYIHVDGTAADALEPIVAAVNGAEKHQLDETVQRRYAERFQIFIGLAVILLAIERTISTRRRVTPPAGGQRGASATKGVAA